LTVWTAGAVTVSIAGSLFGFRTRRLSGPPLRRLVLARLVALGRYLDSPGRHELGRELAPRVGAPDLVRVSGCAADRGVDALKEGADAFQVAAKELLGLLVVCSANHLRKVDDGWSAGGQQHVVGRQIAVHEVTAQDAGDLLPKIRIHRCRLLACDGRVDQPRSRAAVGPEHQLTPASKSF
jgi:hypothetical protein